MGNCLGRLNTPESMVYIGYKQQIAEKSSLSCKITNPIDYQPTHNLGSEDKEIPILNDYRVDQIYPDALVEIFLLLEFDKEQMNYKSYCELSKDLLRIENDSQSNLRIFEKKDYIYLKKLSKFAAKTNQLLIRKKLESTKLETRVFFIYYGNYLYGFSYPFIQEVDDFDMNSC